MAADDETNGDPTLARWQANEARRTIILAILVVIVLIQSVVGGFLTAEIFSTGSTTTRIEQSEEEQACARVIEAEFLASIGASILLPREDVEARTTALERIAGITTTMQGIVRGEHPCELVEALTLAQQVKEE